ncbi:biotin--[acetyl-CoA-carboxylase] ligase [Lottiidibacillus patelloidae]|uniref:Bifunctional ligase/repressor BirA n=1 Tax=Lottiidibacillus patelloidae TaxID=2670334 RepID=A0A263BVU5_9BACI|nr:biotin--[acetyl-CoA-carboxylase] ligase [Lottiidibacillus patelloidae]OZM57296.1 biotin--[acetyl-CoA-carboxylase] ligase [Lottiidibacillus patelloidae]
MPSSIREELLAVFNNEKETYISGQMLSEKLNCTRTAIWKHIEELRNEGYVIEAVQKRGYRMTGRPDKLSSDVVKRNLTTNKIGQNIHFYETTPSTQRIAHLLAQQGKPEGTVVFAEEQTEGKGRLDRSWHSPVGAGIWMSIILRPNLPPQHAPQLTLLAAVAIVRAIESELNITCEIKWPNDILINGKKAVGILTELHAEADRINSVIVGIGINVNTTKEEFPSELQHLATSLSLEKGGDKIDRASLARVIFESLEEMYEKYLEHGFTFIKLLWESYSVSIGKQIIARTISGEIRGYARGITDEGVLMIEESDGKIQYIHSADIEL